MQGNKLVDNIDTEQITDGLTIENLVATHSLTVRAQTVCENSRFNNLTDILNYYRKNRNFLKIRNCGTKTNDELKTLCEQYNGIGLSNNAYEERNGILNLEECGEMTLEDLAVSDDLSIRSINVCLSEKLFVLNQIIEFYQNHQSFKSIRNCGVKSDTELISLCNKYKPFNAFGKINSTHSSDSISENIIVEQTSLFHTDFSVFKTNVTGCITDDIIVNNNQIKLLKLVERVIQRSMIVKESEQIIFDQLYKRNDATNTVHIPLDDRHIKRIRAKFDRFLSNSLKWLRDIDTRDVSAHVLRLKSSIIYLDEVLVSSVNQSDNVNFSLDFYFKVLRELYSRTHQKLELIQGSNRVSGSTEVNVGYLIDRNLWKVFNFEDYLLEWRRLIIDKREFDTDINFNGFTWSYFYNVDTTSNEVKDEVVNLCRDLFYREFNLIVELDRVILERNSRPRLFEVIVSVLEEHGRPMSISELYIAVKLKAPELKMKESSIRATVLRRSDLFFTIGRQSTYGLRTMEHEEDGVKGGTIRDIVQKFIESKGRPTHISEIITEVNRYRSTNERSIITNMKLEKVNRFVFFPGLYFGLVGVKYDDSPSKLRDIVGSHFRSTFLVRHIGRSLNSVCNEYVAKYNYTFEQVRYALLKRAEDQVLILDDNEVIVNIHNK